MNNFEEIKLDKFHIVGISVRTQNPNGKGAVDIDNLFKRFFAEKVASLIDNKESDDVYCLYTDYDSNFMGKYTAIIGCKVSSTDEIPKGLVVKEINASNYRVYVSEGKISESVRKTWTSIWEEGERINRTYSTDFDLYGLEAANPNNAVVKTFLSIK